MRPNLPEYRGFGALIPLDYGHPGHKPEHSLLLVPDDWDSLRDLLEWPYAFLRNAHASFSYDDSTRKYDWDLLGPMTIILDPLTVPSRASAEGLRILASTLAMKHECECECGRESPYEQVSDAIRDVIPQWQNLNHDEWRDKVIEACTEPGKSFKGYYLVEYALITRVMVIRYIPPDLEEYQDRPFYRDKITAVTFSDFLNGLGARFLPRTAYMHFDLLPEDGNYSHAVAARLKANFSVDYIISPIWTLSRLCNPWTKRLDRGKSAYDYHYASASFVREGRTLKITPNTDAQENDDFPVTENSEPRLDRINGTYDPTVILESVDPWGDGWVWKHVPTTPSPGSGEWNQDRSFQGKGGVEPPNDPSTPLPCVLIYITVNGEGQWVIDPSSTLVKNYVAPTNPPTG